MFKRTRDRLTSMIERYLARLEEGVRCFRLAMDAYYRQGRGRDFDNLLEKTHTCESLADDIRREIEIDLYEKYLIPDSRGDVLRLIESTDNVLEKVQSILYQIQTERLEIPDLISADFRKLVEINLEAFEAVISGIRYLFGDTGRVKDITAEVDRFESASDRLERELIRTLFASDADIGQKILLKELIIEAGNISDLSETVADQLNIITVKRLI